MITGSVVFNVKSMNNIDKIKEINNIENIKNFDKINVINNIKDQLKKTNLFINKFTEEVFLESLDVYNLSEIKKIEVENGRGVIKDGRITYNNLSYLSCLTYNNILDSYKKKVSNIFEGKSLFFYQIDDYFLQYVQLKFLYTIFNINGVDNIFRKLLNLHLYLFDKKYLFYDFLDGKTSQNYENLKIETIIKNINKYLQDEKYIEYDYLSSENFENNKNDKIILGLTSNHNNILSIGVVQGLTYYKKNLLFDYLGKKPINGFRDLTGEIVINDVIFNKLQKLDNDLFKNNNNIDKYVFLYQSIKNFIDGNTHEFDHFMYFIYQDIFNYYSKLNTNESMFLVEYKEFYNIFSLYKISGSVTFSFFINK